MLRLLPTCLDVVLDVFPNVVLDDFLKLVLKLFVDVVIDGPVVVYLYINVDLRKD